MMSWRFAPGVPYSNIVCKSLNNTAKKEKVEEKSSISETFALLEVELKKPHR